jgi:chromosome segregation ATPase
MSNSVDLMKDDISRREKLCEKYIAELVGKNVSLEKEIEKINTVIQNLEKEKSNANAAVASQSSSILEKVLSSVKSEISGKISEQQKADKKNEVLHRDNDTAIKKLSEEIGVLQTVIQENKNKIENRKKSSEEDKKKYENELSELNADIAAKNIELKQANDDLKEKQEHFDTELDKLTKQRDTAFGNINSDNSDNSVSGGRRTVWRRCPSRRRRRHHRRRTNKIRKSRNGRKIQRN